MIKSPLDHIPEAHRESALTALACAFGTAAIDAIAPVPGGVSGASVFRVDAAGRRYVLRIEGQPSPLRNPHQYVAMRTASQAGIAPPLRFVDEQAGMAVMDFVAAQPLSTYPGGSRALARAVGDVIRSVQATPVFPNFVSYPQIVTRLWAHVCRTDLFASGVLDAHSERLRNICDAYAWQPESLVSSHNDLLPRNLLFDGERLWVIDWESAYRNDPLVDVAIALDNFAPSVELESVLLNAWLGQAPNRDLCERLEMIRSLTRLYYAGVLFSASAAARWREPDDDLAAPSSSEFEQAVRAGKLRPDTPETTHVLGKMYLASFFSGVAAPGLPPPFSHFQI